MVLPSDAQVKILASTLGRAPSPPAAPPPLQAKTKPALFLSIVIQDSSIFHNGPEKRFLLQCLETLMTQNTPATPTAEPHLSFSAMFLLFSLSLLGLLLLSQQFLLPHFTRVPLAGSLLDADELQTKEADLSAAVDQAEDARRAELLPTRDPLFQSL
jgi:hypothetical protein